MQQRVCRCPHRLLQPFSAAGVVRHPLHAAAAAPPPRAFVARLPLQSRGPAAAAASDTASPPPPPPPPPSAAPAPRLPLRPQRAAAAAAAAAAADTAPPPTAPPPRPGAGTRIVLPSHALASRVLFVGGLPAQLPAATLEQQLLAACTGAGCRPTRVQVAPFDNEKQRSRFAAGWLHKGFALVAFHGEAELQAAAAAIATHSSHAWGLTAADIGPARRAPRDWPPELTYTPTELAELQQQQTALDTRRSHNRRKRQRQSQRLVQSVEQLLGALGHPFGAAAWQQYQPLVGPAASQQLLVAARAAENAQQQQQQQQCDDGQAAQDAGMSLALWRSMCWPRVAALLQDQLQQQQASRRAPSTFQGPITLAATPPLEQVERQLLLQWSKLPPVVDPAFGGRLAAADVVRAGHGPVNLRACRKRVQVESFVLLMVQLVARGQQQQPLRVVEFGAGSGNLVCGLAHLFQQHQFVAVDMKRSAVALLQERVQRAGLSNLCVHYGRIEEFTGTADIVLALHACGSATDLALEQAARCRAAFIASPCCIGKLNRHSITGAVHYPRSHNLQQQLGSVAAQEVELQHDRQQGGVALFRLMAAAGDYSHQDQHSFPALAALAKSNVELDRGQRMAEGGFRTALVRLLQPELTAKSDVLLGVPEGDHRFCFDNWS